VAIVFINDEDYRDRQLFNGHSPLNPKRLARLIDAIAAGDPAVIGVDVDTSAPEFREEFPVGRRAPRIVWEREVRHLPASASEKKKPEPQDVLGGKTDLDPTRNTLGLPLLIEDGEDGVTRRYRRLIPTTGGDLPSFPWAVAQAFWKETDARRAVPSESTEELVIRYSGDRNGSHRVKLTALKTLEMAKYWPSGSPFQKKVVLLGGSYSDQDEHDTPLGRLTGVEVLANVIETELDHGGGRKPAGTAVVLILQLFESVVLILVFHALRLRWALATSLAAIPILAILCSLIASRTLSQVGYFLPLLLGLAAFELYEHARRTMVPRAYGKLVGKSDDFGAPH
jgi:CHASE2 domain-containing sensor protein